MADPKAPPVGPVYNTSPGPITVIVSGPSEVKSSDPRVKIVVKGG